MWLAVGPAFAKRRATHMLDGLPIRGRCAPPPALRQLVPPGVVAPGLQRLRTWAATAPLLYSRPRLELRLCSARLWALPATSLFCMCCWGRPRICERRSVNGLHVHSLRRQAGREELSCRREMLSGKGRRWWGGQHRVKRCDKLERWVAVEVDCGMDMGCWGLER